MVLIFILFAGALSANPKPPETDATETGSPKTPAELIEFLTGTVWRLHSADSAYRDEGTLRFTEKGVVEHLYGDGVLEKKHWGVTSDMKIIWGGKFLRVCRFSKDFNSFADSRFETTGKRVIRHDDPEDKVTAKK